MTTTIKRKQLTLHVQNQTEIIRAWLTFVSGIRQFTNREIDVLEVLIEKRGLLIQNQLKGKYLSELLFSTNSRKEYTKLLKITDFNFTNILSSIKKKGAIVIHNEGEFDQYEDVDLNLIPADELTIKFVINDQRTEDSGEDSH